MLVYQRLQAGGVVLALPELGPVLGVAGAQVLGAADVEALVDAGADGVDAGLSGGGSNRT